MDSVEMSRPAAKVAEVLAAEVRHWRLQRGWTRRELAQRLSFDLSYVARVESGKPTENFARRSDIALEAGGRIWALWEEYSRARATSPKVQGPLEVGRAQLERTVRIERDDSVQTFDGHAYTVTVTRQLYNATDRPVVRCPVGISASHFVGAGDAFDPHAGTFWSRIGLVATSGDQPMLFKPEPYPDRLAEGWLYFENDGCRFPLYPGRTAPVSYTYTVPRKSWGDRFERVVTLPTAHLSIALRFPREFAPLSVWGTEDSDAVSQQPLSSEIGRARADSDGGWSEYRWTTTAAPLWTAYRLEWQFAQTRDGGRPDQHYGLRRAA